jgi:hypothetical protein
MSDDDPAAAGSEPDPDDPMGPPKEPCECWCMHCRRTFMSTEIWFQKVINDPQGFKGFWMCPTPNCGGAGFCFDIFPTDPDHPANAGWVDDDDEDAEGDEEFFDEDEFDDDEGSEESAGADWDPDEAKWKSLDEELGPEEDDDIEGEEWKHGLAPGERPPEPDWMEQARREQEEEERKYDEPDERPRVVDWKDRDDRTHPPQSTGGEGFTDDDIPF